MNKLVLNSKARNHFRMYPLCKVDAFKGFEHSEDACEALYNGLLKDRDAQRLSIEKNKSKGYMITVWHQPSNGLYFLICSIRNEFKTFNNTIYIDNHGDDMVKIAKFLKENIDGIMADYKDQILEARADLLKSKFNDTRA